MSREAINRNKNVVEHKEVNLKTMTSFLILLFFSAGLLSDEIDLSYDAYEKAQEMRNNAYTLIQEAAEQRNLVQAEEILKQALIFVREPRIKAMYRENKYLESRQWDIVRDLVKVESLLKKKDVSLSYISQLSSNFQGLSWLLDDTDVVNFLGKDLEFLKVKSRDLAWKRISTIESFKSDYKYNISDSEKVAGLSLLWSTVRQNFVYFDQVPNVDWDKQYLDYIPKVLDTESTQEYYLKLIELISLLKDAHTNVYYPQELHSKVYARPPLRTAFIENKVIVTDIYSKSLLEKGISIGDELIQVEGEPVYQYGIKSIAPFVSSSTKQDLMVRVFRYALLSGASDNGILLKLRKPSGKELELTLPRRGYHDVSEPENYEFKLLEGDIAYLRVNSFGSRDFLKTLENNFKRLQQTKGLIIDIRENGGGSTSIGFNLLKYLTRQPVVGSVSHSRKFVSTDMANNYQDTVSWENLGQYSYDTNVSDIYGNKVIVLVGPATFSAAEDFLVAFQQLDRGLTIGESTAGSSGQPLAFSLPGGGSARVCVKRDSFANGEDWVGKGIDPDINISMNVSDVINRNDAALELAISKIKE